MPAMTPRLPRALEFALVFIGLPLLLAWQGEAMRRWLLPQILLIAALMLVTLWRDPSFDRRQLRLWPTRWQPCLTRIVLLLVLGGATVLALALQFPQVEPFDFPRRHPAFWLLVMLLYPLVSVVAQELVFRVFLFHRYRGLFPAPWALVLASAAVFALAHAQLGNAVAPALSLVGGLLFAYTYARSRSLPLVVLEHGLWGDWLFTLGLGAYFYGGHL